MLRISIAYVDGLAEETTSQRIASYTVIIITTTVTIVAARYILRKLVEVKPDVIYQRRKARFVPLRCPFCTLELRMVRYSAKPRLSSAPLTITTTTRPYPRSTRTHLIQISRCSHTIRRGKPDSEGPAINNGTSRATPSDTLLTPVYMRRVRALQRSARQRCTTRL